MALVIDELLRPSAYPKPWPASVELRETHISWVFLTDHDAYKLKKPVALGFLDYSNLELRLRACQAEVTLNSRLAPGIYQGVVPITRHENEGCRVGGKGPIIDWAVHMTRLPDARRGDVMLESGAIGILEIQELASRIARFHSGARRDASTARFGDVGAIRANLAENFSQAGDALRRALGDSQARALEHWQHSYLDRHAASFQRRADTGHVRDGHGDMRLEQIYFLENPPRTLILDCIEFNDRFRYADTACDLAFLSMDLRFLGRPDLAEQLLSQYARETNDFELYELIDFYESYRAFVRGKVATYLASERGTSADVRGRATARARAYFELALAYVKSHRSVTPPCVIAVGGLIASGKSTLAEALRERTGIPVIDTDRARKWLLGVPSEARLPDAPWQGAYGRVVSARVYGECLKRASLILESSRSVILDASFRSRDARARTRAFARAHSARFLLVECRAPLSVCRERVREREKHVGVSDGRTAIFDEFLRRFEPIHELPETEHWIADTSQPIPALVESLIRRLNLDPTAPKSA